MSEDGWYGNRVAAHSGIATAPPVHALGKSRSGTAATLLRLDRPTFTETTPTPTTDGFVLTLPFDEIYEREAWLDGSGRSQIQTVLPGEFSFMDLRRNAKFVFRSPFSLVQFYVPRLALDEVTEELNAVRIDEFAIPVLSCHADPVMAALAHSMRPTFERAHEASALYVDSVIRATSVHLVLRYAQLRSLRLPRGQLAPWQAKRALECLDANLDGEIVLEQVARECGLSVSYFARAFRATVGQAPHQWLLARRVDRAKSMMRETAMALSEIALACGFADQSHFTRVFTARERVSPGAWRRTIA